MRLREADQSFEVHGSVFVPLHSLPCAGGVFLGDGPDAVEHYLKLPSKWTMGVADTNIGGARRVRRDLAAARVHGDSMTGISVFDGDVIVFDRGSRHRIQNGDVAVIERHGEDGMGALALKRFMVVKPRFSYRDDFNEEIDWDDAVIVLRSENPRVSAQEMDPTGRYRSRGKFLSTVAPWEVKLVHTEELQARMRRR